MLILFISVCGGLATGYYVSVINKVSLELLPESYKISLFIWETSSLVLIFYYKKSRLVLKNIGLKTANTYFVLFLCIYAYGVFDNIAEKLSLLEHVKILTEVSNQKE